MKGLFIPGITTEMFRNGCLESIEALMSEGKIFDIETDWAWISVSEMLPEETGRYLGYVSNRSVESPYGYIITCGYYAKLNYWATDDEVASNNVVAWMPLPEPYRGGDSE